MRAQNGFTDQPRGTTLAEHEAGGGAAETAVVGASLGATDRGGMTSRGATPGRMAGRAIERRSRVKWRGDFCSSQCKYKKRIFYFFSRRTCFTIVIELFCGQ